MRHSLLRFLFFLLVLLILIAGLFCWKFFQTKASLPKPHLDISHHVTHPLFEQERETTYIKNSTLAESDEEQTNLIAKAIPSVVSITTTDAPSRETLLKNFFAFSEKPLPFSNKMGSGLIVSDQGHIITNWHVIKDAIEVMVQLSDGRAFPAKLTGFDARSDIAIIRIRVEGVTPITLGDSDKVRAGQRVFAVGNPFGLQETVTQGIISAKGRRASSEAANEFFQTSALINPGNSGGPLINVHGEVIGINNFIISQSGGAEGLSFATPSNVARRAYNDIIEYGHVVRPWFGVIMRHLSPSLAGQIGLKSTLGALVITTLKGSPAEAAGVQEGDVITAFNDQPIVDRLDLRNRIAKTKAGDTVTVTIWRHGKTLKLAIKIKEEPGDR